ncbi:MAG: M14 family metallopeptidase [Gemmatimonadota bacterium]|nr:MAG: M14 family metallopeptidase [Gemmatimonadota bacterium]
MRTVALICSLLALTTVAAACAPETPPPDLSDLVTRAEATDFVETSSYQDVMDFATALAEADDRVHLTSFGTTFEGRSMPLLVIGSDDPSPEAVRASGKTRIYLQGNIHAGEVAGKEALLMLLRDWVKGEYPDWTESAVLLVAPIYNADGNERMALTNRPRQNGPVGGMGQRPNAQGLDLNRDHMKLASPEARAVVRLMRDYDPHVAVDLHTTNGTHHAYYLTYAPPLHPDTDAGIIELLRGDWLPSVTRTIKEKHGWDYYYYGNSSRSVPEGEAPRWATFDHRPRFNNNYVGLRNRFAILSEAYAYATFEDRVMASLYFVEEILNYAHEHGTEIRRITAEADARSVVGMSLSVRSQLVAAEEPVTILMGAVEEEEHPETGEVMLRRLDVSNPVERIEYGTFAATERVTAPATYILTSELSDIVDVLNLHGIRTKKTSTETTLTVQEFVVESTKVSVRPFQGRQEREVWGAYREMERTFAPGTTMISVAQPLGLLAFQLLEPRADDGFLDWAMLDRFVEVGSPYPVVRSMTPVNVR